MINEAADGQTEIVACLFWIFSWTVILRPFQSAVPLAISSPTFFGDYKRICTLENKLLNQEQKVAILSSLTRPNGPILGAKEEVAPTSPPTHLMYTTKKKLI